MRFQKCLDSCGPGLRFTTISLYIDLDRAKKAALVNIVIESIVYSNKNIKLVLRHCCGQVARFFC